MPKAADVDLRDASRRDVPTIRDIAEAAYTLYVPRIGKRPAPMDADFEREVACGFIRVAVRSGRVVGYLCARPEDGAMLLESVAIDPVAAGMGVGRKLISDFEARALNNGFARAVLYTHVTMTENAGLYGYLGYREVDRRCEDGFERIYFAKDLSEKPPNV